MGCFALRRGVPFFMPAVSRENPFLFPFQCPAVVGRTSCGGRVVDAVQGPLAGGSACLKLTLSGASLSVGSATWCWLDDNYRVIAALGVIVGAVVGITGLILQHRAHSRRHAIEYAEHQVRMQRLRNFTDS